MKRRISRKGVDLQQWNETVEGDDGVTWHFVFVNDDVPEMLDGVHATWRVISGGRQIDAGEYSVDEQIDPETAVEDIKDELLNDIDHGAFQTKNPSGMIEIKFDVPPTKSQRSIRRR